MKSVFQHRCKYNAVRNKDRKTAPRSQEKFVTERTTYVWSRKSSLSYVQNLQLRSYIMHPVHIFRETTKKVFSKKYRARELHQNDIAAEKCVRIKLRLIVESEVTICKDIKRILKYFGK